MSELEEIGEMIRNAMRLVEQAQEAGEQLRNHTNRENLDEFRRQVQGATCRTFAPAAGFTA
jgi:hypothetical protein